MYTTITVDREIKQRLEELFHEYRAKTWNDFFEKLTLMHPRCPHCNGVLVQKFASNKLVCIRCSREYTLVEE